MTHSRPRLPLPWHLLPRRAGAVALLALLGACSSVPDRQAFDRFSDSPLADAEVMPTTLQRTRPRVLVLSADEGNDPMARNRQLGESVARSVTQILTGRAIDVVDATPAPQLLDALRQAEIAGRGSYEGPAQADVVVRPVITRADYRVDYTPPRVEARQVAVTPQPALAPQLVAASPPQQQQQQTVSTTTTSRKIVKKGEKSEKDDKGKKESTEGRNNRTVVQRQTTTTTTTSTAGNSLAAPAVQAAPVQPQYVTTLVNIPASHQHQAGVAGSLQVHALPSLRLLASIPISGSETMSSPTQAANDATGAAMLRTAADRATQGGRAALLNVFAVKGHVTAKRTLEDKTLLQISLGSQDGLRKGDTVELLSVRKPAPLFDGTQPPDEEVLVTRAVVTEMLATTTAWVFVKKETDALKVRRGDVARLRHAQ